MDDKSRILMEIIRGLYSTLLFKVRDHNYYNEGLKREYVHFDYSNNNIQKGDLVMGTSIMPHDYFIGWVEEVLSYGHCMIRELGSNRVCDYSNEGFVKIVGLRPEQLWEQEHREFYQKVLKAFRRGGEILILYI